MPLVITPEIALALSFAVRDLLGTLLDNLAGMTPEEREAWRAAQMKKKIEHDEWLDEHLGGP
ncbi:MAG: hypothetical protein ACW99G_22165 [Candidatus Thorarchaeota archaeon]|jgi:hypothetical protein